MDFITAKEARELTDKALLTTYSEELERINNEIFNNAIEGANEITATFHYKSDNFFETAKKAPLFFKTLGYKISDEYNYNGSHQYVFVISW